MLFRSYSTTDRLNGLHGLGYALAHLSCVFLMCDRRDVGCAVTASVDEATFHPTIFIYDNYPGGIGMSRPLYEIREQVLAATRQLIATCPCQDGCPSCVGPVMHGKDVALALLQIVRE